MQESGKLAHWERIEALFESASELPPGERARFLADACGSDADLLKEVQALLAADDGAGNFLDTPVLGEESRLGVSPGSAAGGDEAESRPGAGIGGPAADRLLGREIGGYLLERVIGSGGMGTVYLGVRDDHHLHREVAVKVIRFGMDTEAIARRFDRERRALASLDHPNIARFLDGGTTEESFPYLVMEYVEGRPIDVHCNESELSARKRLELFQGVCAAVQFAHRKLVVHRDIKPGNILVTPDGVPKLLDFGIAKILRSDMTDPAETTITQRFLSPDYASPEQVRGEPITTATDTYSLGVTLYELLTGRRPYRLARRTPGQIEQIISDEEPVKPSVAVRHTGEVDSGNGHGGENRTGGARTGEDRARKVITIQGGPERLRRQLAGDLDTIILMALRKAPEERYASVGEFSDDIGRYLGGLPVQARRPTIRYRMAKFVRRNRALVAAGVLLLISVVAGGVGIVREARRAEAEAEISGRVLATLDSLFQGFDPQAQGGEVTVRDILGRGSERVMRDLEDLPEAQAMLAERIAGVYMGLGVHEEAVPWFEKALAIYSERFGGYYPKVATASYRLGQSLLFTDLQHAEDHVRKALTIQRRRPDDESPEIAASLHTLASILWKQGDLAAPKELFREALEMRRRVLEEPHADLVESLRVMANYMQDNGRYAEAEQLAREAVAMARHLGSGYSQRAVKGGLAGVLQDTGRYAEAEPFARESLAEARERLGENHPSTASDKLNLALLLKDMGELEAAESLCREGLETLIEQLGQEKQAGVSIGWFALAKVLLDKGDLPGAESAARKAVALSNSEAAQGRRLTLLAQILADSGRFDEAEPVVREALRVHLATLPPESWKTAKTANVLGSILTGLGRYEEAEPLLVESYPVIRNDRGPDYRRTKESLQNVVDLYESWNRPEEAERYRALAETAGGAEVAHVP